MSKHRLELEWSRTLIAEQKHCCPQRYRALLCALGPQQHFPRGSLKGKGRKWLFGARKKQPKTPSLWYLDHTSLPLHGLTPRPVCHVAARRLQLWCIITTFAFGPAFLQL